MTSALPPEPLEEVFPRTSVIVDAVVVEVLFEDTTSPKKKGTSPRQEVVLKINRVVRGELSPEEQKTMRMKVEKPEAPYWLREGIKGPWLIHVDKGASHNTILGRYGPDSYTFEKIDEKLKELNPAHLQK